MFQCCIQNDFLSTIFQFANFPFNYRNSPTYSIYRVLRYPLHCFQLLISNGLFCYSFFLNFYLLHFNTFLFKKMGFPWWLSDQESTCQCMRCGLIPASGRSPWRRKWQPTPVFLPGNPMDTGAWLATVCGVTKEPDITQ